MKRSDCNIYDDILIGIFLVLQMSIVLNEH